ncbi:ATP-binding cassette domain-containing protein [Corallococcus exercitus]|uniref:ATP-binding cassette domain-containing protein n=1 Tax=Corallococcus exercitus TaxID=2316736 RepID=UPI000EA221F5|nr:ATP-binding cassette domain-containing protein [Corallococcus exercitus]
MSDSWEALSWPGRSLGQAIPALAQACGLTYRNAPLPSPVAQAGAPASAWSTWLEDAASWLGLELELVGTFYPEVEQMLAGAAPALIQLPGEGEPRFILLVGGTRRKVKLLTPELRRVHLPLQRLHEVLCQELERAREPVLQRMLSATQVPEGRRARVRAALLRNQLRSRWVGGCWLLRYPPGASFWNQVKQRKLHLKLLTLVAAQAFSYGGWLLAWWLLGRGALSGRLDPGVILGWAALLVALVPLRMLMAWMAGRMSVEGGGLLKQRLLAGALWLEPEEIRSEGVGRTFSRVLEAEAVESLTMGGGVQAVLALLELVFAGAILAVGAGGGVHLALLLVALAAGALVGWRYARLRAQWTGLRLLLTHELSERMLGYRTRLMHETLEQWHHDEDQGLSQYLSVSRRMDGVQVLLGTLPRVWMVLGLLGLLHTLVSAPASPEGLAVGIGGMLLARQALVRANLGLSRLIDAVLAWDKVGPLYRAAARGQEECAPGALVAPLTDSAEKGPEKVVEARGLGFQYPGRTRPVLQGAELSLMRGERTLLEGPSGSGKSTLAALLSGVRIPTEGLLLSQGLDHATLGLRGWRRRIVLVPQFHENHVLTGAFAFNLLMGRSWPANAQDLREAESLCQELGLGDLLQRMPGGLQQVVGETGWRLSHGERSRLFIARALLQRPSMVILDESFAALDPITLKRCMECVVRRAPALMVIAHP